MKSQLTIMLVLRTGGDYSFQDVEILAFHLRSQYTGDLRIICLYDKIDQPIQLVDNLELIPMPNHWRGWWSKMNLYSPEMEKYRPFLFMDLDTVIIDSIDTLFPPKKVDEFITLENVYKDDCIGSGLMWIPENSDKIQKVWDRWLKLGHLYYESKSTGYGDQDFLQDTIEIDSYWEKDKITSFKPREGRLEFLPANVSIVYFHGKPRPRKAAEEIDWVHTYMTRKISKPELRIKYARVINLAERKDRLRLFEEQKFPFKVKRFNAVKNEEGYKGCTASHLAVLRELSDQKDNFPFVIFEDDCYMTVTWGIVDRIMLQLPPDWDILYLGANLNSKASKCSTNIYKIKDAWATHGIIYGSKRVVDYILEQEKEIDRIDVFYADEIQYKFNCYVMNPMGAIQAANYSDVMNGFRDYEKVLTDNHKKFIEDVG